MEQEGATALHVTGYQVDDLIIDLGRPTQSQYILEARRHLTSIRMFGSTARLGPYLEARLG